MNVIDLSWKLAKIFDDTRAFWLPKNATSTCTSPLCLATKPLKHHHKVPKTIELPFQLHHPSQYSTEFQTSNIIHLKIATFC